MSMERRLPTGGGTGLARLARWALVAVSVAGLAACSSSETDAPSAAGSALARAPNAGFVTIHPQEIVLSSGVAGRVTALQTAEIRPQVGGLIKERVFAEGGEVKQGDVLYRLDAQSYEAEVTSAQASLQKAQAALPSAQAKFDRYRNLSASQVVSQQDRDDAQSAFLQAKADVAVAEATLRTAQINLGYATITAPIDGRISTSTANAGSLVTASQETALATIRQLDTVYVDLTETSGNLLRFRNQLRQGNLTPLVGEGRKPEVRLAFPDGSSYPLTGTIDAAEQFVSQTTSSFTIRARFANPDRVLLPGMYVLATVSLASDKQGFLVPQRAVSRNGEGHPTARFIKPDGTAETRVLTVSTDIGTNWLVSAGVADGDRLIVDGLQNVRDGAAVTPVEVTLDANGRVAPKAGAAAVAKASSAATANAAGNATE